MAVVISGKQPAATNCDKTQIPMLLEALASVVITSRYDGDTCISSTGEKIRIACIDAPEMKASPRLRPT